MGENGYSDELYDLGLELDKVLILLLFLIRFRDSMQSEDELLSRIAFWLTKLKYQDNAAEILRKVLNRFCLILLFILVEDWGCQRIGATLCCFSQLGTRS